jgi:hypothetical protein
VLVIFSLGAVPDASGCWAAGGDVCVGVSWAMAGTPMRAANDKTVRSFFMCFTALLIGKVAPRLA